MKVLQDEKRFPHQPDRRGKIRLEERGEKVRGEKGNRDGETERDLVH